MGPGDSAQFTDHVLYWDTDYGDLIGNVWTIGAVGQAVLTLATPGKTLTLDSLKGGGWFRSDRPVGVRVYALDWTPLFNSELVFPGIGHLDVAFGLSTTTGFILQWGPDSFNGGIDDLTFTVDAGGSAVPEPSSWALMIAGFGVTGAAMRRRKAALA